MNIAKTRVRLKPSTSREVKLSPAAHRANEEWKYISEPEVPSSLADALSEVMTDWSSSPTKYPIEPEISEVIGEFLREYMSLRIVAFKEFIEYINYADQEVRSVILIQCPQFFDYVLNPTEEDKVAKKSAEL